MTELHYLGLLLALFVVPRLLERLRIPAPVTSLAVGAVSGMAFGAFRDDTTIRLLATLGISSLFLFAGLELDSSALHKGRSVLAVHLLVRAVVLGVTSVALVHLLGLELRPAALVALAILTPSTGFILQTLGRLGLEDDERFWVKVKAIAAELLALGTLFLVLQTTTLLRFVLSLSVLVAMVAVLPTVFRVFAQRIAPYAPKSEFAFLLMLAVACAFLTKKLGVYYLVGAFVVGVAAQRFREQLPAMASEQMLNAVELFASVFVPVYFFSAGLHLEPEDFAGRALLLSLALSTLVLPLRVVLVAAHRKIALQEDSSRARRVGLALLPTLVFGLVIAEILRDRFGASPILVGALVLYTVVSTLVPGFVLRLPPAHLLTIDEPDDAEPPRNRRVR